MQRLKNKDKPNKYKPESARAHKTIRIMTTTFKTFAIAAMMTVFTTTAFAINNKYNNKNNNRVVNTYAVTKHRGAANQNNITMTEYNNAKRCNCKTCKDIVNKYEAQVKKHKNNNKKNCNCQNCKKAGVVTNAHGVTSGHMANTPQAGHSANVSQTGHVTSGRR